MVDPTEANIRTTIRISDTTVLSSAAITLAIADAKTITGSTDELALRFYTCFHIADNWDAVSGVRTIEGVTFNPPRPEGFLRAYDKRIKKLMVDGSKTVGMAKVMTNKDFSYDETENTVRPRRGGDNYY
jgi:hypothetical protein